MIIHTNSGAVIVVNDCHWTPGVYLSVSKGSGAGAIVAHQPGNGETELDTLIAELTRIRDAANQRKEAA